GLYAMMRTLAKVAAGEYTVDEVDAITGPPLGRPKSATFRTLDLAGLDILGHVVKNLGERMGGAQAGVWTLPPFFVSMLERGMTGEKAGQGFYKRVRQPDGESAILTIDPATLEYGPQKKPRIPSLEATASLTDVRERVRALFAAQDKAGSLLRDTLAPTLVYTANVTPSIAYSADDVDRVMRWGFGWELGPFELMDAIGEQNVIDAARKADPTLVPVALKRTARAGDVPPAAPDLQILRTAKEQRGVLKKNAGASLVDLGDGVLCVEFHSKMNSIGGDTIQMLQVGLREASRNFAALVVGNDAPNFSAGANLMLVLLEAQEEN